MRRTVDYNPNLRLGSPGPCPAGSILVGAVSGSELAEESGLFAPQPTVCEGPGSPCIFLFYMPTISQRELDICAAQRSEEWEVLSVSSHDFELITLVTTL
jgi:hypothetical protein